jgi:PAT family beta-lactamase induction signal transducer AmpG
MEQYAFASGTVGLVASFVATLLGGYLISRHGLRRWIWPFVLAQNTLNLLYMWLASGSGEGLPAWTLVVTLEAFGSGLGTAVFMVYLMRCCGREHRAAHMALLTALMSLGFTIAGVASGFLAEALGFTSYFGFTFLASLPAMALIPLLPNLDRPAGGSRA